MGEIANSERPYNRYELAAAHRTSAFRSAFAGRTRWQHPAVHHRLPESQREASGDDIFPFNVCHETSCRLVLAFDVALRARSLRTCGTTTSLPGFRTTTTWRRPRRPRRPRALAELTIACSLRSRAMPRRCGCRGPGGSSRASFRWFRFHRWPQFSSEPWWRRRNVALLRLGHLPGIEGAEAREPGLDAWELAERRARPTRIHE